MVPEQQGEDYEMEDIDGYILNAFDPQSKNLTHPRPQILHHHSRPVMPWHLTKGPVLRKWMMRKTEG